MKRFFCIVLCAVLLASLAAPAIAKAQNPALPLVVVQGFGAEPLLKNQGAEDEISVFPPADGRTWVKAIAALLPGTVLGVFDAFLGSGLAGFVERVIPGIKILFDPLRTDEGGNLLDSAVGTVSYKGNLADIPAGRSSSFGVGDAWAQKYGWDHVYSFVYDWRRSVHDLAKELNDYVQLAKKETGQKVNIAALSMGSTVANVYLAEYAAKNNFADLADVVYLSPGWQGTSSVAALLCNELSINVAALQQMAVEGAAASLWSGPGYDDFAHLPAWERRFLQAFSDGSLALLSGLFSVLKATGFQTFSEELSAAAEQLYVRELASHWQGIWALVPYEAYDKAIAACFPNGGRSAAETGMIAGFEKYHKIQGNMPNTVKALQKAGVGFAIISLYGLVIQPITKTADTWASDGTIDTRYTGGFPRLASSAPGAAALTAQEKNNKHDHLSGDGLVDASVCWFPENTWFIKGLRHADYKNDEDPSLLALWLLEGGAQKTVLADKKWPQFTAYDPATGALTPNM